MQDVSGSSPLSSTGQTHNSNSRFTSTAGKYSNGGRVGRRTCARIRHLPLAGLLAGRRTPGAEPALVRPVTCANRPVIGPVTLTTWPPPGALGGPFLPVTVAAFASSRDVLAVVAIRSTPRSGPAREGRALAEGSAARELGAPRVSVRRCAAAAPREEPGAPRRTGTLAGHRLSGCPFRALTLPMPGAGRWRRIAARLALCRSLAASPVSTGGKRSRPANEPGIHAYRSVSARRSRFSGKADRRAYWPVMRVLDQGRLYGQRTAAWIGRRRSMAPVVGQGLGLRSRTVAPVPGTGRPGAVMRGNCDFLLLLRGPLTLPCAPGRARIEPNRGCAVGVLPGQACRVPAGPHVAVPGCRAPAVSGGKG